MSPKQSIYREFFRLALPCIRSHLSLSFWRRWRGNKAMSEEAELIHNLYVSMFDPDFTDHDIWFLNVQARSYCQTAPFSPLYLQHAGLIRELFALVPEDLRPKLKWDGPPAVLNAD